MGTSDLPHTKDEAPRKDGRSRKVQDKLDDALADSFPASDPVSIVTSHAEDDWVTGGDSGSPEEQTQRQPGNPASGDPDAPPSGAPAGGH